MSGMMKVKIVYKHGKDKSTFDLNRIRGEYCVYKNVRKIKDTVQFSVSILINTPLGYIIFTLDIRNLQFEAKSLVVGHEMSLSY